jgi:hypothetical protein
LGNYTISYATGTMTVNAKALTVTANNDSKAYGQARSYGAGSTAFTSSGLQNGETIGSVTITASGGSAANAPVGSYSLTPSAASGGTFTASNYSITYVSGRLSVNPAALTITANNDSKTYGQTRSYGAGSTAFTSSGLQNGESIGSVTLTASGGSAANAPVGSYSLTPSAASGGTFTASNYSISYVAGSLIVNRAALTVTATNQGKTYGTAVTPAGTEFSTSGLLNSDSVTSVTLTSSGYAAAATVAGSPYAITPSAAVGTGLGNYSISYVPGTMTVTPATLTVLTVTANNASKLYGQANPAFSANYSGFVNGDTTAVLSGSPSLTTTATTSSPVGSYTITAGQGTLSAANYTFAFVNGTLTINPAPLTISADNKSVQYSDPNPPFTASYSGFVLGQRPGVLSGTLGLTTPRTLLSNVGTYPITPSGLTSTNYTITYVAGTLTVTPEDARVVYTGTTFAVAALGSSSATVTLSATVQDVPATASDPAYGNISTATVTFVNRATGAVLCSNVPVGLVNPGDITAGTATCNVTLPTGTTATDYTIGILVGGNYARNSSLDNTVVEVTQNLPGFITGGGYIVASASAGAYAADNGSNVNFGFNVKYNSSQTNLQGHANIIVRKTVGGTLHVYQIQTNSILSMGFGPAANQAQYTAKANINDITDPNNPISVAGNQTFQMTLTDNGAGSRDTIGFTVQDPHGGLQFSSNWNPNPGRTVEQVLAGGSLLVHQNQLLQGAPRSGSAPIRALDVQMVQAVLPRALAVWQAAGFDTARLRDNDLEIADLPAGTLAWSSHNITFDRTAQGYGWFTDATQAPPPDQVDLLTVVTHELGHQLGFEVNQDAHDVMGEYLAPGVRRLSNADEVLPAATLSARQPAPFVPAGPKSDANLRSSPPPLLLSSAGEEVAGMLVAQTTPPASAFDHNQAALAAILAEWTSARSYTDRVANLSGTGSGPSNNGNYFLIASGPSATVFDNGASNVLHGGSGLDWFFANLATDTLTGLHDQEIVEVLG